MAHGYVKRFALWCMKYLVNYGKNWNLIQKYFIMNIRVCEEIFLRGIVLKGNGKINWRKGEDMLAKIKALPEKVAFTIGLSLILLSPLVLFLMSFLFSYGYWTAIIQAIVWGVAILFILSAADKRHPHSSKKH